MTDIARLSIAGCQVAVLDLAGSDPSIRPRVFLHGLGSSSIATFSRIISRPPLNEARSILIDLPGFGYSTMRHPIGTTDSGNVAECDLAPSARQPRRPHAAEQVLSQAHAHHFDATPLGIEEQARIVAEVLNQMQLGAVDLFGHSMGGSIAMACAYHHPRVISRLVVAEPNLDPGAGTLSAHIAAQSERRFVARGYDALLRATRLQVGRGSVAARSFEETLQMASPLALHRSATSLLVARSPTFREMLETMDIPRATITGALSPPLQIAPSDPRIKGYVVPNAGHAMMVENPDSFAQVLHATLINFACLSPLCRVTCGG